MVEKLSVLIVGSGLSAICMAAALQERNLPFCIQPLAFPFGGTAASSGILNPLTGRKRIPDVHFKELYPEAIRFYQQQEARLATVFFHPISILEYASTPAEEALFKERTTTHPQWISIKDKRNNIFEIKGSYVLNKEIFIKNFLKKNAANCLPTLPDFKMEEIYFGEDYLKYQNKKYSRLILCNGTAAVDNIYFKNIPLHSNKGQVWLVRMEGLDRQYIHKNTGLTLVPWQDDLWWAGASFEWKYASPEPTRDYEEMLRRKLEDFPGLPFELIKPLSGIRPSMANRSAVAEWHPEQKRLGILNGMGTKGVLQAPFAALKLAESLLINKKISIFGLEGRL